MITILSALAWLTLGILLGALLRRSAARDANAAFYIADRVETLQAKWVHQSLHTPVDRGEWFLGAATGRGCCAEDLKKVLAEAERIRRGLA